MTFPKPHWVFLFFFAIAPAVLDWQTYKEKQGRLMAGRVPADAASPDDCMSIAKELLVSKNYEINHKAALSDKKLITFTNKFVTVQHPRMDWINRTRISLNKSLRNWNNNRYPSFYLFNDEEIVPASKKYFTTLEKKLTDQLPLTKDETENEAMVSAWIKSYQDYKADVDKLLDERISLQYNLSQLKKLKLKEEMRDIKLQVMKNGMITEEVITLRKEDKNLGHLISRFKADIAALDGTMLRNGKIKDRIIRQAMLNDILTILHRELEYAVKNAPEKHEGMLQELENLQTLIKNEEFKPTTYGVYRVANKVFMREALATSKLDVLYKKVKEPVTAIKDLFVNFLKNRTPPNPDEPEKIGMFKKIYNKITSITPKQAAYGTGTAGVLAYGYYRYFWVSTPTIEPQDRMTVEELEPGHLEQLEATKAEEVKKSEGHSEVIEVSIDELLK